MFARNATIFLKKLGPNLKHTLRNKNAKSNMNSVRKKEKSNIDTIHVISLFCFSMCILSLDLKFLRVVVTFLVKFIFLNFLKHLRTIILNLKHREYPST